MKPSLPRRRTIFVALIAMPLAIGLWACWASSWRPKITHLVTTPITALAWQRGHLQVSTSTENFSLNDLSLTTQTRAKRLLPSHSPDSVLSPDGKLVAFSGGDVDDAQHPGLYSPDYWVALVDARTGKRTSRISTCMAGALAFSPDGNRFFEGATSCGPTPAGEIGNWALLEVKKQKFSRVFLERDESAQFALWSHDGKRVWFALRGGEVGNVTRDGKPGQRFKPFPSVLVDERDVTAFTLSPDEKMVALATEAAGGPSPDLVSVVDAHTGRVLSTCVADSWIKVFAFSPDSEQLAFASANTVSLCSPRTISNPRSLMAKGATALAFSPDGYHLAVGTSTGDVQLWRVK